MLNGYPGFKPFSNCIFDHTSFEKLVTGFGSYVEAAG
jgi:hypothetical protein